MQSGSPGASPEVHGSKAEGPTYRALDRQSEEIRIINVRNSRQGPQGQIVCQMCASSVKETFRDNCGLPYVAVSYAWGDVKVTENIVVDGHEVAIPRSLHGALKAIINATFLTSSEVDQVSIWADYLCINQHDTEERSSQVSMMDKIYQNAHSVAIWLGAGLEAADCDMLAKEIAAIEAFSSSSEWVEHCARMDRSYLKRLLLSLALLFSRSYFQRLWVATEIFNAKRIDVYFGTQKVSWAALQEISFALQQLPARHLVDEMLPIIYTVKDTSLDHSYSDDIDMDFMSPNQILKYHGPASLGRMLANKGTGSINHDDILEYLRIGRSKLARNPHDRVYALRGLFPESMRSTIRVDYSSQVKDLYIDTVTQILFGTRRLDAIREAIHFPPHTNNEDLPSWVMDLHHRNLISSLRSRVPEDDFHADRGQVQAEFVFPDEPFKRRVQIKAIPLGTIHAIGIALNAIGRISDYLAAFTNWRAIHLHDMKWRNAESPDGSTRAEEIRHFEFCETLMMKGHLPGENVDETDSHRQELRDECYTLFASLFTHRLPEQPLDEALRSYATLTSEQCAEKRQYFQETFAENMLGRCFCITEEGNLGLGTGYMNPNDLVVVPYVCATPVILRPCRGSLVYQYIGDVYIHGYMYGKAVEEEGSGKRRAEWYVIK